MIKYWGLAEKLTEKLEFHIQFAFFSLYVHVTYYYYSLLSRL